MRYSESDARRDMVRVCHKMYEKGFISASEGNVSIRLAPNRILMTPSGVHKGFLEAEQIVMVNTAGKMIQTASGLNRKLRPTSELSMHLEAYAQRPDIGAVVHAHPKHAIVLSIADIPIAACLIPEVVVFLGLIPTSDYATPSTNENAYAVRQHIGNHDAMVLRRHGSVTVGKDVMQAFMRLETLEHSAEIAFKLAQLGVNNPLTSDQMGTLIQMRQDMGLAKEGEAAEICVACGVKHEGAPEGTFSDHEIRQMVAESVNDVLGRG